MVLGLLIMAIISSAVVSVALFVMSWPLWIVLIAYPITGTLVMLFGLSFARLLSRLQGQPAPVPSHFPVQRNTTPTVANSTLTSVPNDNIRS